MQTRQCANCGDLKPIRLFRDQNARTKNITTGEIKHICDDCFYERYVFKTPKIKFQFCRMSIKKRMRIFEPEDFYFNIFT